MGCAGATLSFYDSAHSKRQQESGYIDPEEEWARDETQLPAKGNMRSPPDQAKYPT